MTITCLPCVNCFCVMLIYMHLYLFNANIMLITNCRKTSPQCSKNCGHLFMGKGEFMDIRCKDIQGYSGFSKDGQSNFKTLERIFWGLTFVLSFYGMGIYSYYTFQRYFSDPVSMYVETEFIHWNSTFPAISICLVKGRSYQPLIPVGRKLNISFNSDFLHTVHRCMFANLYQKENSIDESYNTCIELSTVFGIDVSDINEMVLPKNCSEFLHSVYFGQKKYRCDDIFKHHQTELGSCFIANSIMDSGYSFENLKLKYGLMSKSKSLSMFLKIFKLWDYALLVHSPEDLPIYNSVSKEVFEHATMFSYNIDNIMTGPDAAEKSIGERACRFPNEKLQGSPFHYSFSTCMSFLRIQTELKECNCTQSNSPEEYRSRYCKPLGLMCLRNADIFNKSRQLAMEQNICLPACTELILGYVGQSEMIATTNKSYKEITVELPNLPYSRIKRAVVRTKLDLAASIAGLAGLFFGASVLNFIELIYYLVKGK